MSTTQGVKESDGGVQADPDFLGANPAAEAKEGAPPSTEEPPTTEANSEAVAEAAGSAAAAPTEATAESIASIPDGAPVTATSDLHPGVVDPETLKPDLVAGKAAAPVKPGEAPTKAKPRWLDQEEERLFDAVATVENEIGYNSRIATQAIMVKRAAAIAAAKNEGEEGASGDPAEEKPEDKATAIPATPKRRAANFWRMVWKELNLPGRSWYSIRQHYIKLENEIKRQNLNSIQEYHLLRDPAANREQVWEALKHWDEESEVRLFEVVDSLEDDLGFKGNGNPLGKGRGRTVSGKRKAKNFWRNVTTNLGLDPYCWEVIREQHSRLETELRRLKMRTIQEYQARRRSAPECCHYKTAAIDLSTLNSSNKRRKVMMTSMEAEAKPPNPIGRPKKIKPAKKTATAEIEEAVFGSVRSAAEEASGPQTDGAPAAARKRRREELSDRVAESKEEASDEVTGDAGSMECPTLPMSGERFLARTKQTKRVRNEAADGDGNVQPNKWEEIRKKFLMILRKMSLARHQIESYENNGWGQGSISHRKIKPEAELERARKVVNKGKAEAKELLREVYMMNSDVPLWDKFIDENGDVDVDELVCSRCGKGDDVPGNDILLCDHEGCFRAYHQNCCEPALSSECLDPEFDWFCWQCETYAMCLEMLCEEFDQDWSSWEEVFPELENTGLQDVDLPESDPEDDNWEPPAELSPRKGRGRKRRRGAQDDAHHESEEDENENDLEGVIDDDGVDMEELRALIDDAKDTNSAVEIEDPFDTTNEKIDTSNIVRGKRRRRKVDYNALAAEMIGNNEMAAFDDDGDSEDYVA